MLRIISDYSLWGLIEDSKQYRMILYADTIYRKRIERLLKLVDVRLDYQVSDEEEYDCRSVYDLIFEDKDQIMVITAKDNWTLTKKVLDGLDLQLGVNYKDIKRYSRESHLLPYYYDPILGYNLGTREKGTEGFCIYGDIENAELRILTLGGSTTDGSVYPFKSWSGCLHDVLNEKRVSNVVICGGVAGHSSSEELFKLIRDGFSLKPDIVLNCSGGNDMQVEDEYPYINFYMRQICQYLMHKSDIGRLNFDSHDFGVSYGINSHECGGIREKCNFWLENQKMIHMMCQSKNIKHITFFQPTLFSDIKQLSIRERAYQLNLVYVGVKRECKVSYANKVKDFAKLVRQDIQKYEWLYDLSGIFGAEDIYMDFGHVNEKGNRILAEHVADICLNESLISYS